MLDTNFEVRVLKTGRRAVFALSDFIPGDIIFTWDADNTFTNEQYAVLSPEQKAFVIFYEGAWTFMTEPMCYVQHSTNPNAGARRGVLVAIKEIHMGEEVTTDLRSTEV